MGNETERIVFRPQSNVSLSHDDTVTPHSIDINLDSNLVVSQSTAHSTNHISTISETKEEDMEIELAGLIHTAHSVNSKSPNPGVVARHVVAIEARNIVNKDLAKQT